MFCNLIVNLFFFKYSFSTFDTIECGYCIILNMYQKMTTFYNLCIKKGIPDTLILHFKFMVH